MIIRQITKDDMPEVFSWFATRKYPQPIVESIAPDFGIVAEEDGILKACMWAYLTGRSIAFVEWVATNPSVRDHRKYTDALIQHLKTMCEHSDPPIRALCFYTQNEKLAGQFKHAGFSKGKEYFRMLWTTKNM